MSDVCPHRGASLAMGSLVGTTGKDGPGKCVKCPYHGLEFNAAGTCQKKNIHLDPIKVRATLFHCKKWPGGLRRSLPLGALGFAKSFVFASCCLLMGVLLILKSPRCKS